MISDIINYFCCRHTYKIIKTVRVCWSKPDEYASTKYHLQCTKCGRLKIKEL